MSDGKTYSLGGESLSEDQRESVKKFQQNQDAKTQELAKKQMEHRKTNQRATLEQLLKTKLDPFEDRVIIWPDAVEEVTDGGIIKPEEVLQKERPFRGTVIAVGPGKKIEQTVTNTLLLNLLQFASEITKDQMDILKEQVLESAIPMTPGMKIFYGRMAGTPINDPDTKEELLIMRPSDCFTQIRE